MRSALLVPLFLLAPAGLFAQSPVKETLAYSRETIPGTPISRDAASVRNPFPTSYYLYLVIKKGTPISASGVRLQGKWHAASLKRVDSPVVLEHDPNVPTGKKDTLVGETSDDVYQVDISPPETADCKDHAAERFANYDVVVCLKSGRASWYGLAMRIVSLSPAAAP